MTDPTPAPDEWNEALADASEHVEERSSAQAEGAAKARPKRRGPLIAILLVVLGAVVAWDAYVLMQPTEGLAPAEQDTDLRWIVADVVETVVDFREDEGRLPTRAELVELTGEDEIVYVVQGEAFQVALESDGVRVEYDESVPLDAWVARAPVEGGP